MGNPIEKRLNQRVRLESFSGVRISGPVTEATAIDLSIEGVRVRTELPLALREELLITLFNGAIQCKAQVCWTSPTAEQSEVGLQLANDSRSILSRLLSQLPKPLHELKVVFVTSTSLLADSVTLYLQLFQVEVIALTSLESAFGSLVTTSCDLLVFDDQTSDIANLPHMMKENPQLESMPLILLSERLTQPLLDFRTTHPLFEILTKPVGVQALVLRAVALMEHASRYEKMKEHLASTQQQLANAQQSYDSQNRQLMEMMNQVLHKSSALGQLIQLQDSLSQLESLSEMVRISQQWAMDQLSTPINIWLYSSDELTLLGPQPLEHPTLTLAERQGILKSFLKQDRKILHDDVILISKKDFILEILSTTTNGDVVDLLTFFMKAVALSFQSHLHAVEFRHSA